VLTLELFVAGDRLLANEMAPRVHNSGHWTIEGSETSQFANHLKAITGQSLGSTATIAWPGMVNLIGLIPDAARSLDDDRLYLHDYGKSPREGRKLGHITCVAETAEARKMLIDRLDGL
jgi:5-(carboxyamino)imidazole ribonucleotide synthase